MFSGELSEVTDRTLNTLRRVRQTVLEKKEFTPDLELQAYNLINGWVSLALDFFYDGAVNPDLYHNQLLVCNQSNNTLSRKLATVYCHRSEYFLNNYSLLARASNPLKRLLDDNRQNIKPSEGSIICSPLASGPLVVETVARLSGRRMPVLLAATGTGHGSNRQVYLPDQSSWQREPLNLSGPLLILDDAVNSRGTIDSINNHLKSKSHSLHIR